MAIITVVGTATALVVGLLALRLVVSYLSYPLKAFPGPFLAKFTNLWRLFDYWGHTQIQSHQKLHEKFGPAVRIGPNMVSLSDPGLLKVVYSIRPDYVKVRLSPSGHLLRAAALSVSSCFVLILVP